MFGTKGNNWRKNMNTVMDNGGVWGDLKYTFNGKVYVIPVKLLKNSKNTYAAIRACKANDKTTIDSMGIHVVGGK